MLKYAYPYQTPETVKPLFCASGSPKQIFSSLREIGYDGIELLVRDTKELNRRELDSLSHSNQLEIASIGTGPMVADDGLTYTSKKKETRKLAVQRTIDAIEWGAYFDCPITIGKLRGQINQEDKSTSWGFMDEALYEILDFAEKLNVSILIEPQQVAHMNNLTRTDETLSFISRFESDSLGIMLDTVHMYAEEKKQTFPELFTKARDQLGFIHLTDSDRLPPGEGTFDMKEIVRTIDSLPNCPYISLEVKQQGNPLKVAHNCLRYLKKRSFK